MLSFSFFSFSHICCAEQSNSLVKAADFNHYATSVLVLNRITDQVFSKLPFKKTPVAPEAEKNKRQKRLSCLVLSLTRSILVSGKTAAVLMIVMVFGCGIMKKSDYTNNTRKCTITPKMKFYLWWVLKFMNPLQKYIDNLALKYDMNPIRYIGAALRASKENPHCVSRRTKCGFFLFVDTVDMEKGEI